MLIGQNADHLFGPNARRAECRPQLLVLGWNADSKRMQESNQTKRVTLKVKDSRFYTQ